MDMTLTPTETPEAPVVAAAAQPAAQRRQPRRKGPQPGQADATKVAAPVLEMLFQLYPQLFGAEFLPLKLGIYQELLAAHPDLLQRDTLKVALGLHARSSRYLQAVAARKPRHDLQGQVVEDVAPEHVYQAILELFRRRQARTRDDLRPLLRQQLIEAFEASGLSRQDYLLRVQNQEGLAHPALDDALAEYDQQRARHEALRSAFKTSGKTLEEFADMYGMDPAEVAAAVA
jgi:hypothetical protein